MRSLFFNDLPADFGARALRWAAAFPHCVYCEPNGLDYPLGPFPQLLAVAGAAAATATTLPELAALAERTSRPLVGFLTYELKNELEALRSDNPTGLAWPTLHFFEPDYWLRWQGDGIEIHAPDPAATLGAILATEVPASVAPAVPPLRPRMARATYLDAVEAVRQDIRAGEVYELNLCQEFFAEGVALDPVATFERLQAASPAPFAGLVRWQQHYLLCASPERFLSHTAGCITSQPIKGTRPRATDPVADEQQRLALLHDEKERAENLMIVDLVRNDLARVAQPGTVRVPELFGTYGFRQVWQLISTVQAELPPVTPLPEVLQATFPMGSMTGAPKIRAMQLIEHYEQHQRGLFSGSFGVLWPGGDFDLNVVIRSLQYRTDTGYASLQVGSAITYDSVPAQEYAECLVKAQGVLQALGTVLGE